MSSRVRCVPGLRHTPATPGEERRGESARVRSAPHGESARVRSAPHGESARVRNAPHSESARVRNAPLSRLRGSSPVRKAAVKAEPKEASKAIHRSSSEPHLKAVHRSNSEPNVVPRTSGTRRNSFGGSGMIRRAPASSSANRSSTEVQRTAPAPLPLNRGRRNSLGAASSGGSRRTRSPPRPAPKTPRDATQTPVQTPRGTISQTPRGPTPQTPRGPTPQTPRETPRTVGRTPPPPVRMQRAPSFTTTATATTPAVSELPSEATDTATDTTPAPPGPLVQPVGILQRAGSARTKGSARARGVRWTEEKPQVFLLDRCERERQEEAVVCCGIVHDPDCPARCANVSGYRYCPSCGGGADSDVKRLVVVLTSDGEGAGFQFGKNTKVSHVRPGSPADLAGLRRDMRVIAVSGMRVTSRRDFWTVLRQVGHPRQYVLNAVDDQGNSSDEDTETETEETETETTETETESTMSVTEEETDAGNEGEF
eukprot:Hpha_TRINITY_DN13712_c0_g1::TRINITY_DN13712_c0_g1_i1::g.142189::m.142189